MNYNRQADLVDSTIFKTPIYLIGAGGIGSFTALTLAKMGFKQLNIWDPDEVENHNLPNQFYQIQDVGRTKLGALLPIIYRFTDCRSMMMCPHEWQNNHKLNGLVIMAVDSISVRDEIFQHVKDNKKVIGFIDGRMGGQNAEVYTINPKEQQWMKFYDSRLWDSRDVDDVPCTERAIIYNVCWIASVICNQARLYLEGKIYKRGIMMDFENMEMIDLSKTKVVKDGERKVVSRV